MQLDKRQKLVLLAGHYQRADRVLSQRPVVIKVDNTTYGASSPIAWSVDEKIYFNVYKMPPLNKDSDYVIAFGVNGHELAHVMFTPTSRDIALNKEMSDLVTNPWLARLFNILEDQRIESMMVALYSSMRLYFTAIVVEYISKDITDAHLLTYGRRYLPPDLRRQLRDNYVIQGPPLLEIEQIIDRYRVLNLVKQTDMTLAALLVRKLALILACNSAEVPKQSDCGRSSKTSTSAQPRGNSPEQDKALEKLKDGEDEREEDAGESPEPEEDDEPDEMDGEEEDEDDEEEEDGDDSGGDDADEGEGGEPNDDLEEGEGDLEEGSDDGSSGSGASSADVRDTLEKLKDELTTDEDLAREVRQARQAVNSSEYAPTTITARQPQRSYILPQTRGTASLVIDALRSIEADVDPGWERYQSSGVLDGVRAMTRDSHDETIWRRWDEGNAYGTDQELVLLLDHSSSMYGHTQGLSEAAWVMKRAADVIGVRLTVLAFESSPSIVYEATDRADYTLMPSISSRGGTNPHAALTAAYTIFSMSRRRHKMMAIMTDGAWDSDARAMSESVIEKISKAGVATALFHLIPGSKYGLDVKPEAHRCGTARYIGSLRELTLIVKDLMGQIIKGER